MKDKFKAALIQMDAQDNVEENKKIIEEFTSKAAEKGAELIIFPEHSDAIGKHERRFATDVPGEMSEFYASLAAKYKLYLHCGSMTEKSDTDRPYNTSLVFDPEGKQIGLYRKLHMFDVEVENGPNIKESHGVTPGDRISLVDTKLCKLGLSVCYDLRFCELFRILAINGAELIVVSANFTYNTGKAHWETLVHARAIENGCYVAAVDQCGEKFNFRAWGHTMLVDPMGNIIEALENDPGMIIAEIDPSAVKSAQNQIPVLQNIRKDIYTLDSKFIYKY